MVLIKLDWGTLINFKDMPVNGIGSGKLKVSLPNKNFKKIRSVVTVDSLQYTSNEGCFQTYIPLEKGGVSRS